NAIGVAGTGAAIPIWRGIPRGGNAPDRNSGNRLSHSQESGLGLGQWGLVEGLVDVLVRGRILNFGHLIGVARRKFDVTMPLLVHIRGNAELLLSFLVPGIQVLIFDWPIHELTVLRLHLEIVRHKPQARAQPMRRAARNAIVGASERSRTLLNQIGLFGASPIAEPTLRPEPNPRR